MLHAFDNSVIFRRVWFRVLAVCVCVFRGGGGRQPVQFKGKIQGSHKAGSAGWKTRQQEGEGKVVGICWAGLTLKPTTVFGIFTPACRPRISLCDQPELDHGKTGFLSTTFQLFHHRCSADKSSRKLLSLCVCVRVYLCACMCADGKELS